MLPFAKLCGAGNDFIVVQAADLEPAHPAGLRGEEIVRLCDRRYGIGADGLMVMKPGADGVAFEVDFCNADGSGGMLCGNGARCAIERARTLGLVQMGERVRFRFAGADYSGISLAEGRARFELDPRFRMDDPSTIRVGDLTLRGRFVDVGSLHFVVDVGSILDSDGRRAFSDIDAVPLETLGQAVRHHADFGPKGVNANFTELRDGRLFVRTFERGVEAETLACGTGSTSSALVRWRDGQAEPPVTVVARSGDELIIDFDIPTETPEQPGIWTAPRLSLTGPAFVSFEGRVKIPE
jgi:diaminopimelate epimerase